MKSSEQAVPLAVVTGASRGIGRKITELLASEGYNIAALSRNIDKDHDFPFMIRSLGVEYLPLSFDISDVDKHQAVVDSIIERFGRIDLLVNNAGIAPPQRLDILETTTENYDTTLSVNLRGPFFFTRAVARKMIEKEDTQGKKIIFIGSVSAEMTSVNRGEYCVSKSGISMTSKLYADRLAEYGIRVYEIRPGIIETDMTNPVKEKYDKFLADGKIPLNRWGTTRDVAQAVLSIAKGNFDYSTGIVLDLSGGLNISSL